MTSRRFVYARLIGYPQYPSLWTSRYRFDTAKKPFDCLETGWGDVRTTLWRKWTHAGLVVAACFSLGHSKYRKSQLSSLECLPSSVSLRHHKTMNSFLPRNPVTFANLPSESLIHTEAPHTNPKV
ncbi:hypothetical protein JTE90_012023 [Oedothorax gibbosus]|uniref:Uncharacterized protein n=1 Tax=Oedothorax gibbosus TaxID=931172 RepID=A0AAV6UD72_9ARAC|nr:hypothetical protein JTE90_012023 [Oedothorax gibbosus]